MYMLLTHDNCVCFVAGLSESQAPTYRPPPPATAPLMSGSDVTDGSARTSVAGAVRAASLTAAVQPSSVPNPTRAHSAGTGHQSGRA